MPDTLISWMIMYRRMGSDRGSPGLFFGIVFWKDNWEDGDDRMGAGGIFLSLLFHDLYIYRISMLKCMKDQMIMIVFI